MRTRGETIEMDPPRPEQGHNMPRRSKRRTRTRRLVRPMFCYPTIFLILLMGRSAHAEDRHVLRSSRIDAGQSSSDNTSDRRKIDQKFMVWCQQVLGIHSLLEIEDFKYQLPMLTDDDLESDILDDDAPEPPFVAESFVRGLAASRDITNGEVVLKIPMQALFSVHVVIEQDPVLRPILSEHEPDQQVAVLAVALLHHVRLADDSPLAPYIRMITTADSSALPTLWTAAELRERTTVGVRRVAQRLRLEMREAYSTTVKPLLQSHPTVLNTEDFSYDKFQWAYALVHSRHWQLPITESSRDAAEQPSIMHTGGSFFEEPVVPPADTPTESWVRKAQNEEEMESMAAENAAKARSDHSFLAPVADLLNFGPPCTRIQYDSSSFEVVATCDFTKGQEVTFWYGDDCEDVLFAVYGVADPMIKPCKAAAELKQKADELSAQLETAFLDLELLESELDTAESMLKGCCETHEAETKETKKNSKERQRIRNSWSTRKDEEDEDEEKDL